MARARSLWRNRQLIVLSLFSEVLNRAPGLIVSNVNYVKKVVFPIIMLPVIAMGTALFHSFISLGLLLPLVILTMGLAWMLASLGVFLRDVG